MKSVVILTPDPTDPSYLGQWPGVRDVLVSALQSDEITVTTSPWTDHVESAEGLKGYDLILPMIVWGYHRDYDRWMAACQLWKANDLPLANPASTLMWNADKAYLQGLASAGIPMAQTRFVDAVNAEQIEQAFSAFDTDTLIVKPTISAGAYRTLRLVRSEDWAAQLDQAPVGPAMIQAYLPAIETEGETSLLYFGGKLSHVVNKRPGSEGEFRIQTQFGGHYQALTDVPPQAQDLAQRVLAHFADDLLYARIDMTTDADGRWVLMEAELIEPDLYLAFADGAGANLAAAVRQRA